MVTKKIRTEYMKKFRDPKWETFSKCYEDSLKYRLTRRVMEHSHKPWFWEGWDSGSDSSGWSTPRLSSNKVVPLSLPPPTALETNQRSSGPGPELPPQDEENEKVAVIDGGQATDDGPADIGSSDGEPGNPPARPHRRNPRSEMGHQNSSAGKPPRAKSQPAISNKEIQRSNHCLPHLHLYGLFFQNTSDACVQTHRGSSKRSSNLDRRRARSADLEKVVKQSQLNAVDDRWMTEYMRCFSARLR
uniref:Centriole, cilia and spindle-associated protein a n=1 Tax=Takifugu rubripes TaxID=31033 RepID=A0A674P185_TAKRU